MILLGPATCLSLSLLIPREEPYLTLLMVMTIEATFPLYLRNLRTVMLSVQIPREELMIFPLMEVEEMV